MPTQEPSDEWNRLMTASSVVGELAHYVDNLAQVPARELPEWLTELGVPPGWRIARVDNGVAQPSRIAVGSRYFADGVGFSCETITLFRFTGIPPIKVVQDNCERTLRDLGADGTNTQALAAPQEPGVVAMRSRGYFDTPELRIWAQYSTYLRGSDAADDGRLTQHNVFIAASSAHLFSDDIAQLSDAVHHAFLGEQ